MYISIYYRIDLWLTHTEECSLMSIGITYQGNAAHGEKLLSHGRLAGDRQRYDTHLMLSRREHNVKQRQYSPACPRRCLLLLSAARLRAASHRSIKYGSSSS